MVKRKKDTVASRAEPKRKRKTEEPILEILGRGIIIWRDSGLFRDVCGVVSRVDVDELEIAVAEGKADADIGLHGRAIVRGKAQLYEDWEMRTPEEWRVSLQIRLQNGHEGAAKRQGINWFCGTTNEQQELQ